MSLNKVMLIGNLGKDPEVRYLDNNKVVATFTIATNENYTDKNGEKRTETEWHRIEMWDQLAKIAEKYLKKGSQVYVEGRIRTENWRDKEGNERSDKKIRVSGLTLLGAKQNNDGENVSRQTEHSGSNHQSDSNAQPPVANDDLPF